MLSPTAKQSPNRARFPSYLALISLGRVCNECSSRYSSSPNFLDLFLLLLGPCFAFMRLKISMPLAKAETIDATTAVTSTEDIVVMRTVEGINAGGGCVYEQIARDAG